jgi:succinylglutamate desuccinylase
LIVLVGGLHGNEYAGIAAIAQTFSLIRNTTRHAHPAFCGKLVGIIGNLRATAYRQRFLKTDLNRIWTPEQVSRVSTNPKPELSDEDLELSELHATLLTLVGTYQPDTLILIDLHTTSSAGGAFCIPADTDASLRLAKSFQAPVILGLMDGVQGALIQYVVERHLTTGGCPKFTLGVAFEAGQHHDEESVSRGVTAVLNCLVDSGFIDAALVPARMLTPVPIQNLGLPPVSKLTHIHRTNLGDGFKMRPGYYHFKPVVVGEQLADDNTGPISSPQNGFILMPLYQEKGSEGFYLVEPFPFR